VSWIGGSEELLFASLMANDAASFCRDLASYLSQRVGIRMRTLEDVPWQERERHLYRGEAHLGVVCGLQYVRCVERVERPGVELLAAPVMRGVRYENRPIYFSDVVVRREHPAQSLGDLRDASWAYNEPTSHSGFGITRYVLAARGERGVFFSRVVESGAHERSLSLLLEDEVDATAIDSTVLEQQFRLQPDLVDRIRVVETLGPSPIPPLVVTRTLPASLRAALERALLEMHLDSVGVAVLGAGAMQQFVRVTDANYDPIRHMARVGARMAAWPRSPELAGQSR
jgi:phosphonate transport system substrate-binding protein